MLLVFFYFNRHYTSLSYAEYALLVVLPNKPSLMKLDQEALKKKRDKLLLKMFNKKKISYDCYISSIGEDILDWTYKIPKDAFHLMFLSKKEYPNMDFVNSTLDYNLQKEIIKLSTDYLKNLKKSKVENLSVLLLDNKKNEVLAYLGNAAYYLDGGKYSYIDMIKINRSTGSTLKPILYALSLDKSIILPSMLYPDVPTKIGNFYPRNFDKKYRGAVKIQDALIESLNIPFVYLLKEYGVMPFKIDLKNLGMTNIDLKKDYGLPLILGGLELSLWDLASLYSSMVKNLQGESFEKASYIQGIKSNESYKNTISKEAIYLTLDTISNLKRPSDYAFKNFSSFRKIAWKTGTSFGNKDAISIGISPKYTLAVWLGNSDGQGKPEIVGIKSSAPLFFEIWSLLEKSAWFKKPKGIVNLEVCKESGYLKNRNCDKTELIEATKKWI